LKNKIRLGILGGGGDSFIGIVHRIASSMHDSYEIIGGVFNPDFSENIKFAKEIGLNEDRIYQDYEEMIEAELKLDESQRMRMLSEEGDQDEAKRNQFPLNASVTVAKIKITEAVPSLGQKATD
jgi:hypothetical protein